MAAGTGIAPAGTGSTLRLPRSGPPGGIAPGGFHESSAATAHPSAASVYNPTRSTMPHLANTASPLSASAHTSGTGSFEVSGLPATPGTVHRSIASVVNESAGAFMRAPVSAAAAPFGFPNPATTPNFPIAGRIPDLVHVTTPSTPNASGGSSGGSSSSGNSGGTNTNNSNNGNQNYGSSPEGTLESGALGNLLYDLLGPAGTGVTPGDAGLSVTPVSPTTTTSSPNVMVGLLALGVLAGVGWYYLKERKKGKGAAGGNGHGE
jgi:hypothetical protein